MSEELNAIKKLLKSDRLVFGTNNTIKKLRENKIEKIWLSSNTPSNLKDQIGKYTEMNDIAVVQLDLPNDEFGVFCKKQFPVSVASLIKG